MGSVGRVGVKVPFVVGGKGVCGWGRCLGVDIYGCMVVCMRVGMFVLTGWAHHWQCMGDWMQERQSVKEVHS